jgi:hypothetical protein
MLSGQLLEDVIVLGKLPAAKAALAYEHKNPGQ